MANSTLRRKPAKPAPDFPLFPHATGRWAKKIRGKLHYFGPWGDPDAAVQKYQQQRDDLHAGRTPGRASSDGLTIREVCNHFLTAKMQQRDAGDIRPQTFADYFATCKLVVGSFGKNRLVDDLVVADFNALRAKLAKSYGPHALSREVTQVRMIFNYAYENDLIDKPIKFGSTFKRPDKQKMRAHRQQSALKNGKRMFEAAELRAIIEAAGKLRRAKSLKAMILLGINCGFGNEDCGRIPKSAVDLKTGWVNYPRPKTAVERRCPLWPETIKAIKDWQRVEPAARRRENSDLLFVTQQGQRWAKNTTANPVSAEMAKLLKRLKLYRYGLGFYALRHTFETIGGDSRDQVAVDFIMGHCDESMAERYREGIADDRLRDVVEHVREWLFAKPKRK